MNDYIDPFDPSQGVSEPRKRREEIIKAVTEGTPFSEGKKKVLVIPPSRSIKADFQETVQRFNIAAGSSQYHIVRHFCERMKASAVDTKVLVHRIEGMSAEQLDVFEVICQGEDFTVKGLLQVIPPIKRFEGDRILILHAFVDLSKVSPGPLNRFFIAALPQGKPSEMGQEAYENELKDKMMTLDQINVFYNICNRVQGVRQDTATILLSRIRRLKPQHAQVLNTFLRQESSFGEKPITDQNIVSLVNLWTELPEIVEPSRFKKLVKGISKKSDKKKNDFKYITRLFKEEAHRSEGSSRGKIIAGVSRFFK